MQAAIRLAALAGFLLHGPALAIADNSNPAADHWAFSPLKRPAVPATDRASGPAQAGCKRPQSPIDAFLLARLDAAGLSPAPPASKTALLRRASYDLTGLPPSPDDVADFLADDSPAAFAKVIERLLASPHYGERWGRHWLDLVRYAETNSYERDGDKPFVWRYRDYVIRSFNEDKPYDRFIVEQLAGDELPDRSPETYIATGYYRLGTWQDEPVDPEQELYEDLDDILRTTGEVFLGTTIGCARCHDHKLEPIPQRDYYRMLAFFRNVRRFGVRAHETIVDASVRVIATPEERRRHAKLVSEHERRLKDAEQRLKEIERSVWDDLTGVEKDEFKSESARVEILKQRVPEKLSRDTFDEYARLTNRRNELRRSTPPGLTQALVVKEHGPKAPPTHVLGRGSAKAPGERVEPGFPVVLDPSEPIIPEPSDGAESTGRRLVLARWIASDANPLTARVMVNRVWQHHFGRGIVGSASNFGTRGDQPTHPDLLDWLAAEFVQGPGVRSHSPTPWSLKHLHRQIMLSSAYQMSSQPDEAALARDPENDLFWRFNMRRLSAEEIRDSILAVNGNLTRTKMYGPSIYSQIPEAVHAGQSRPGEGWGTSPPFERYRRSVYIKVKRSLITPVLESFDFPDTDASCPVRFTTTQPTQALGTLNSDFLNEQAAAFAKLVKERAGDEPGEQVRLALARVLQREPTGQEIARGVQLMQTLIREHKNSPQEALQAFCLVVLNLNEFLYLD